MKDIYKLINYKLNNITSSSWKYIISKLKNNLKDHFTIEIFNDLKDGDLFLDLGEFNNYLGRSLSSLNKKVIGSSSIFYIDSLFLIDNLINKKIKVENINDEQSFVFNSNYYEDMIVIKLNT